MSINRRRLSLTIASGLIVETINKVSPLLILHHAQKYLGLAAFGWAQYGVALLETLQPLVAFGYTNYAMAEVGRAGGAMDRCRQLFSHMTVLKILHAVLVIASCLIWTQWQNSDGHLNENFALLALILGSTAIDAIWFGMVKQKLALFTLLGGLARIFSLLAILYLVRTPDDKHLFMILILIPNVIIALTSGFFALKELQFSRIIPKQLWEVFRGATPYALIAIILILYDRYDLFLVERWFGLESAGAYSGPSKVVQSLIALTGSVVMAFYAEMVRVQDRESLFKHAALSLWCLMAITTPIVFGAPFVETEAMQLLFTHHTPEADGIFSLLSIGIIGNVVITVFGLQLLQLKGKPWLLIQALLLGLLVGPLLAYILRDHLGIKAAAWAVLSSKALSATLAVIYARPLIGRIPWSSLSRTLLAGAAMALVLMLAGPTGLILKLLLGAFVYLFTLVILNRAQVWQVLHHPKIARYWRRNSL